MVKSIAAFLMVSLFLIGCSSAPPVIDEEVLKVMHSPNPTDLHKSTAYTENPLPYIWYYRTEVRNNSDRPLKIVTFNSYFFENWEWVPRNIKKRKLTSRDFSDWYTEGAPVVSGWIQPGQIAICDPNWHGSNRPITSRVKWAFEARDEEGNRYLAEEEIGYIPYGE